MDRCRLPVPRPAVRLVAVALMVGACGGGVGKPATKAQWNDRHGQAVAGVERELAAARAVLDRGDRQAILGACTLLRDDVAQARVGLPVPDPAVDAALRAGLDAVALGDTDCLEGARVASQARLNEKAMAELTAARQRMDQLDQALAAWR